MRHATSGTAFRTRCYLTAALMLIGIGAAMAGVIQTLMH
jgi:hypothetical protein